MVGNFTGKTLEEIEVRQLNPLVLAYIGDSVYELLVREHTIKSNIYDNVNKLHKKAIHFVSAQAQCRVIASIEDSLTEEEMYYFKRGRNAKSFTSAKNASVQEYRIATGFEALIGYLYLCGKFERLDEIFKLILEKSGE